MVLDYRLSKRIQRHNDRKAADELFERYYHEIYVYTFRQCGERELTMDLTYIYISFPLVNIVVLCCFIVCFANAKQYCI